jgi:putative aldouronate transport system permease protein
MASIKLVMGTFFSVLVAILVNETRNRPFKRTVQTISYLPHFVSWVVAANLVLETLSPRGIVNELLVGVGIIESPVLWMGFPKLFWWIIGASHVWKTAGFGAIIYLAAMTSIDPQLYEAADIDGASRLQRIWHITMPGVRATFVILLILNIGWLMEAGFEQQYLLMNALVRDYSEVFTIYVLRYGLQLTRFSFATAAGIFRSAVSIVLVVSANAVAKRLGEETLM